jgi:hypothetical protein
MQVMPNGRENPFSKAEFRSRIRKTAIFVPFSPRERAAVATLVSLSLAFFAGTVSTLDASPDLLLMLLR